MNQEKDVKVFTVSENVVEGLLKLIQSRPYGEVKMLAMAFEYELSQQLQAQQKGENDVVSEPGASKEPTKGEK